MSYLRISMNEHVVKNKNICNITRMKQLFKANKKFAFIPIIDTKRHMREAFNYNFIFRLSRSSPRATPGATASRKEPPPNEPWIFRRSIVETSSVVVANYHATGAGGCSVALFHTRSRDDSHERPKHLVVHT